MKKAIFLLIASGLMIACASDNTTKKPTNDPIEKLVAYLDEQDNNNAHYRVEYEGGRCLKKTENFFISGYKPTHNIKTMRKEGRERTRICLEIIDSCFRAFSWGCSSALHCYHKEVHKLDKDSVLYALGLDVLEGEKMNLEGQGGDYEYYNVHYNGARAATMRYTADKESYTMDIDYITREETGKEAEPLDMKPIMDFIKKKMAESDSVQVYEVSYECSGDDCDQIPFCAGSKASADSCGGITTGHLYVFPPTHAEKKATQIAQEFVERMKNAYINSRPNQTFWIDIFNNGIIDCMMIREENPVYSNTEPVPVKHVYAEMALDGRFCILIIDSILGDYFIPHAWKYVLRLKDHKLEYLPGVEEKKYYD